MKRRKGVKYKKIKINYDLLLFIFIILYVIVALYIAVNISINVDEGTHLLISEFYRDLILNLPKLKSFTKLYDFGISYLVHYPKLTITYAPIFHLTVALMYSFGLNPLIGKITSILYFVLTSIMIYLISAKFLGSKKSGFISVLIFALSPWAFHVMHRALMDYAAFFWSSMTTFLFLKSLETNKKFYFTGSGVAAALTVLSRKFTVFLPISMGLYVLFSNEKQKLKKIFFMGMPFMVIMLPYLWIFYKVGGLGLSQYVFKEAHMASFAEHTNWWEPGFWFYYFYQYTIQTYGIGILVFIFAFLYFKEKDKKWSFFALWFLAAYFTLNFFENPRYTPYLLMPLCLTSSHYFAKLRGRYLIPILIIYLVLPFPMNSKMFEVYHEEEISNYLFESHENIGLLSEYPIYSSIFMYHVSILDENKTTRVYRPCFFMNESREGLITKLNDNEIRTLLVTKGTPEYELIQNVKDLAHLEKTFYINNRTLEVYSFDAKKSRNICNYICLTGEYICTQFESPYDVLN